MTERHEVASPGWLRAICALIECALKDSNEDLSGVSYVWGEEIAGVPSRLNPKNDATVGWTAAVRSGVVSTSPVPPPSNADRIVVVDWDAAEELALHRFGVDPARDDAIAETVRGLEEAGKLRRMVRSPEPDVLSRALRKEEHHLHNLAVDFTAPRASGSDATG